jgi:hypothetical protein
MSELDFSNEDQFQEWLQHIFRSHGWKAFREVSPAATNYRADLLVHHESCGWIGIECKYMSSPRCGSKVGEAIEQIITKYRGEVYPHTTGPVDLWAMAPYYYKDEGYGPDPNTTTREVLCHFGIATIWPRKKGMKIDFAYSSSETKIVLGHETGSYGDIERIREMVSKKKQAFEPDNTKQCQWNKSVNGCSVEASDSITTNGCEVHLCKYHIQRLERHLYERQKQSVPPEN